VRGGYWADNQSRAEDIAKSFAGVMNVQHSLPLTPWGGGSPGCEELTKTAYTEARSNAGLQYHLMKIQSNRSTCLHKLIRITLQLFCLTVIFFGLV